MVGPPLARWSTRAGHRPARQPIKPMPGLQIKTAAGQSDTAGLTPVLGPAVTGKPAHPQDVIIGDGSPTDWRHRVSLPRFAGATLGHNLYWQPVRRAAGQLHRFVQLLSPDGQQGQHRATTLVVAVVIIPPAFGRLLKPWFIASARTCPPTCPPGPYHLLWACMGCVDGGSPWAERCLTSSRD